MLEHIERIRKHALSFVDIKIHEKKYKNGLRYLLYKKHSDELLIVFSAFGSSKIRTYNYVKSLRRCKIDRLFILDPWGYKGSYNLYEGGDKYPWDTTNELITSVIRNGGYKKIITAGSSKGGSCALLFGLNHKVDKIIVGACQYNIGTYLTKKEHMNIFYGMMGNDAGEKEKEMLDSLICNALDKASREKNMPEIHVLFSKKEPTYEQQIKDLLAKLKDCEFPTSLIEEYFDDHSDVGKYFGPYLRKLYVE